MKRTITVGPEPSEEEKLRLEQELRESIGSNSCEESEAPNDEATHTAIDLEFYKATEEERSDALALIRGAITLRENNPNLGRDATLELTLQACRHVANATDHLPPVVVVGDQFARGMEYCDRRERKTGASGTRDQINRSSTRVDHVPRSLQVQADRGRSVNCKFLPSFLWQAQSLSGSHWRF